MTWQLGWLPIFIRKWLSEKCHILRETLEVLETCFVSCIQNPISPVPPVPTAQGCHLACSIAISQVVRTECCAGLIKNAPTAKLPCCPELLNPNSHFLSNPFPVYTYSIASSSSCMLFGLGRFRDWFRTQISAVEPPCKSTITPPFLSTLILYSGL